MGCVNIKDKNKSTRNKKPEINNQTKKTFEEFKNSNIIKFQDDIPIDEQIKKKDSLRDSLRGSIKLDQKIEVIKVNMEEDYQKHINCIIQQTIKQNNEYILKQNAPLADEDCYYQEGFGQQL